MSLQCIADKFLNTLACDSKNRLIWSVSVVTVLTLSLSIYGTSYTVMLFSLHIRSMWETICDAWACWSGWNFGPKSSEYPLFWSSEYPPQWKLSESPNPRVSEYPPKMKIVTESKSESFRIPPQNENCQRVQIREFQNTPHKMKIVRESESESFRIPPPMKIVTEPKSESFRIPTQNENCHRVQIREFQNFKL